MAENKITLQLDKEAAGYLVDLLNAHIGGVANTDREPLGRVRLALDALRFSDSAFAFDRLPLVSLPTDQPYPNLARANDTEARS